MPFILARPVPTPFWRVLLLAALAWIAPVGAAAAADSAVVLMYHRFGETAYPSTNITIEQFEAHIAELKHGGYAVLPLDDILKALFEGRALPDRAVAITVDDAYRSAYTEAWPRLRAAGFPFTIFVATDALDRAFPDYMSWDQLKELAAAGVTIGAHTASHLHMADASAERVADELARSNAAFSARLGFVPDLFSYPYGELSLAVVDQVKGAGYRFAFGQQSGVMFAGADPYNLPRFALNEDYGDIDSFRVRAQALALPVHDFAPADPVIRQNPPAIGFTVASGTEGLDRLQCYAADQGRVPIERLGSARIEVRLSAPLRVGRSRLNCTLRTPEGRYRWFGAMFYLPRR
ncbi:MAG: polysaccharide deacetylase family protein [Alphaproteobacteria bacterium]